MSRKIKPTPDFKDEAEERSFWETRDSADYVDWSKAKRARFPNLMSTFSSRSKSPQISATFPINR